MMKDTKGLEEEGEDEVEDSIAGGGRFIAVEVKHKQFMLEWLKDNIRNTSYTLQNTNH